MARSCFEEIVDIDFDFIENSTDAAVLFVIDDKEVWIPKSQIQNLDDLDLDDHESDGTIELPTWWAYNEGLI